MKRTRIPNFNIEKMIQMNLKLIDILPKFVQKSTTINLISLKKKVKIVFEILIKICIVLRNIFMN